MVIGCDPDLTSYTLTMQVEEGEGTVDPDVGTHEYDEDTVVDLTATPAEGWEFKEWVGDVANADSASTTVVMDTNKTVKAVFEKISYTLTMQVEGEGTVEPDVGTHEYDEDTVVNITAIPAEGYEYKEWVGDVAEAGSVNTTVLMDKDQTVTAVFKEEKDFAGGTGTEEDPYLVSSPAHLNNVRNHLDKHFRQILDIDLSVFENWDPIGVWHDEGHYGNKFFSGVYDGNGYEIHNLTINRPGTDLVGLFAVINEDGVINNVALKDNVIIGNKGLGSLVAWNKGGSITESYAIGTVTGESFVGGLVGSNWGSITESYAIGEITGERSVGGLVGHNNGYYNGSITESYAIGEITGERSVGGLVGSNWSSITESYATGAVIGEHLVGGLVGGNYDSITESYAIGEITGERSVGGLVGFNDGSIIESYATGDVISEGSVREYVGGLVGWNVNGSIRESFATGNVTGESSVGGLVGWNRGSITESYAIGDITGDSDVGGLVGILVGIGSYVKYSYFNQNTTGQSDTGKGIPKTTSEMIQQSTFEPKWDFDSIWGIEEGSSYPYLQWQDSGTYPYP